MKKVILTKLTDDKFEGLHPNYIFEGYEELGIMHKGPTVGESFVLHTGGFFATSGVTDIIEESDTEIIFKTLNSTYKLEIEE